MATEQDYLNQTGNSLIGESNNIDKDLEILNQAKEKLDPKNDVEKIAQLNEVINGLEENKKVIQRVIKSKKSDCVNNNQDIGWMRENIEACKTHLSSQQYAYWAKLVQTEFQGPNPCGTSVTATINGALKYLFNTLKSIKKYYNKFVQPVLNTITSLSDTFSNVIDLISGALRILIQRIRNWIIQKIKNLLGDALNNLFPTLAKTIKDAISKLITDAVFCKFGEIIKGLGNLITDFVMNLIGRLINAPFCAAQQFTNALINNLANRIDQSIKPILDQINSIVGSVGRVAGSVFEVIDFILGFESFLCSSGPECPQIVNFQTSWWGGPPQPAVDRFNNFLNGLNLSSGETQDLLNKFSRWGGPFNMFNDPGGLISPDVDVLGQTLDVECNTGAYVCGVPQIQIFGGGGFGAIAEAIVNKAGQVVGANLRFRGEGYTSAPYVSVVDNCGNGNYAAAYAVLEDEPECPKDPLTGKTIENCKGRPIKQIIITNSGNGYLPAPNGRDEFGNQLAENPGRTDADDTREYIGCLSEIQVISTGIGYSENDSISIEPNIPDLQVKVRLTELGQIVQMDILNSSCGLTEIPIIKINSQTGSGAQFLPIINFTPKEQFIRERGESIDSLEVIQVIDCVLR